VILHPLVLPAIAITTTVCYAVYSTYVPFLFTIVNYLYQCVVCSMPLYCTMKLFIVALYTTGVILVYFTTVP
jgi:hypothetical protein